MVENFQLFDERKGGRRRIIASMFSSWGLIISSGHNYDSTQVGKKKICEQWSKSTLKHYKISKNIKEY